MSIIYLICARVDDSDNLLNMNLSNCSFFMFHYPIFVYLNAADVKLSQKKILWPLEHIKFLFSLTQAMQKEQFV